MKMPDNVEERTQRLDRMKRRKLIQNIIEAVLSGKFTYNDEPLDKIFNQNPPRLEYVSPADRSSYNYGYLDDTYGVPEQG